MINVRFKTFYSSVCCLFPHTWLFHHPPLSTHYCASLQDHTYSPSDMSTYTTFGLYLSIKLSAERNKREERERNEC